MRQPTLFDAGTAPYSGMRSLSDVLDETRVMRANRNASLLDSCVYAVKLSGDVVTYPVVRWSKKRVYYLQHQIRLDDGVHRFIYYADSAALLRDGQVHVDGAGWPAEVGNTLYATERLAELVASRDIRQLRRAMASAHPDRGGTDAEFIAARKRYEQALVMA